MLVPPRAQAAHQQATHLSKQLQRKLAGQPIQPWHYRDFGSLVSLGEYSTVGSLMGKLVGASFFWLSAKMPPAAANSDSRAAELAMAHSRG